MYKKKSVLHFFCTSVLCHSTCLLVTGVGCPAILDNRLFTESELLAFNGYIIT